MFVMQNNAARFWDRFDLVPDVAANIANANANKIACIVGTNVAIGVTQADGWIRATCAGGAADQHIVRTHTTANQGKWENVTWTRGGLATIDAIIRIPSIVAAGSLYQVGFRLTPTQFDLTTDDDICVIRADRSANVNWTFNTSVAGADTAIDSGIEAAAAQIFWMRVAINASGFAEYYIGTDLAVGPIFRAHSATAIDAAEVAMLPCFGVQSSAAQTFEYLAWGLQRQ